jgi:uncharacterized protein (DUF169 family)
VRERRSVMGFVEELEGQFGGRWIGVKFYYGELPTLNISPIKDVRFCEAITTSVVHSVLLTPGDLNCRGANYVFGWDEGVKGEMVERFHSDGFSRLMAEKLVEDLPKITGSLDGIGLNVKNDPDILLSYLQPGQVMKLLRSYQVCLGEELMVSVVSVCGHVAVKSFVENRIAISFGCSFARKYGQITTDRVAIGVPIQVAKDLMVEKTLVS